MIYWVFTTAIVALDQATKQWARLNIPHGQTIVVVKDKLELTHVHNTGAAFGFLAGKPKRLLAMTLLTLCTLIGTFMRLLQEDKQSKVIRFSLGCIIGGAIGNMVDRFKQKHVTDFIYWKFAKNAPVFNVADVFIFLGTFLFLCKQIFLFKKKL